MNERIKELAEQAGMGPMGIAFSSEIMQKFAELIVRECCAIADEVERADMDSFASKFIKAHFGVEE
jgi:hypothetical protein